jgi:hypothetical protein
MILCLIQIHSSFTLTAVPQPSQDALVAHEVVRQLDLDDEVSDGTHFEMPLGFGVFDAHGIAA